MVDSSGASAAGALVGLPVSGNGVDYVQAVEMPLPGTFHGEVTCGVLTATSAPFDVTLFKYVALGDSFSAGEGVKPFLDPTNDCHRSYLAYPLQIEQPGHPGKSIWLRSSEGELGLAWGFQACSGATTSNFLTDGRFGDPLPQLEPNRVGDVNNDNDLPVDAHTSLVTFTIGGNDLEFAEVLKFCYFSRDCTRGRFRGRETLSQFIDRELRELSPQIDAILTRIHQRGEWINGPSYSTTSNTVNDQSFHPNSCGQNAIANLVNLRLNGVLRDVVCPFVP
jgi:GDSL-like Lipase/Acylhydrolase family